MEGEMYLTSFPLIACAAFFLVAVNCSNPANIETAVPHASEIAQPAASSNAADYLVVYGDRLHDAAASFAAYRNTPSCSSAIVSYASISAAFPGSTGAQALRAFLLSAKSSWHRAPRFILILGDGKTGGVPVPDTAASRLSDSYFADADSNADPEYSVGRIPAATNEEALVVLDKIRRFESLSRPNISFIVDDSLPLSVPLTGLFMASFHSILSNASLIPGPVDSFKISNTCLDPVTMYPMANAAQKDSLTRFLNRNAGYVSYLGYANHAQLSNTAILTASSTAPLTSVTMDIVCGSGIADFTKDTSLADALLFMKSGGAAAIIGNAGDQYEQEEEQFQTMFFIRLTGGGYATIGELFNSIQRTNKDTAPANRSKILLGDPAMKAIQIS
jgi:hypothetical protein